ncbi:MAG: hypothetical protein RJA19_622 [Bacteroidota bacterium]|jgi:hypothetical protein
MFEIMKYSPLKTGFWLAGLVGLAFFAGGCKPETEGEIGEPFDKVAGISGTWELRAFLQQDLNSPVKEVRDLSEFYIDGVTQPLRITFAADRTYDVDITLGKNFFGPGGTWAFDDDQYPSELILHTPTDTLVYDLGAMTRTFDTSLGIEYERSCGGTSTVRYSFLFDRLP